MDLLVLCSDGNKLRASVEDVERLIISRIERLAEGNRINCLLVSRLSEDSERIMDIERNRPGDDLITQEGIVDGLDLSKLTPSGGLDDGSLVTAETTNNTVVDKTPLILDRLASQGSGVNFEKVGIGILLLDEIETNVDEPIPRQRKANFLVAVAILVSVGRSAVYSATSV